MQGPKVLISAPAGDMKTIVFNVNDDTMDAERSDYLGRIVHH